MAYRKTTLLKSSALRLVLLVVIAVTLGCRKQIEFEISMVSRRAVMLETVVLSSDAGRQLPFGYVAKDGAANYVGGWQISVGEALTVTWLEEGRPHSSQIKLVSTNVGPKGIEIEIKADGTLAAKPKWHSL